MKDLNQHMTAEEYRRLHDVSAPEKKRPKVMRKLTEYNGRMYDSKLEADMAKSLDRMLKAKIICAWHRQNAYNLPLMREDGHPRTYQIDFDVEISDCFALHIEMKGEWTDYHNQRQADRRQMVEKDYGIKIHVCHSVKEAENVILKAIEEVKA